MNFRKIMYGAPSSIKTSTPSNVVRTTNTSVAESSMKTDLKTRDLLKQNKKQNTRIVNLESTVVRLLKEVAKTKEEMLLLKRTINKD